MPNAKPKKKTPEKLATEFFQILMTSQSPQRDVKPFMAEIQQQYSSRDIQKTLKSTYTLLNNGGLDMIAEYLKELYGYGVNKSCFEKEVKQEVKSVQRDSSSKKTAPVADKVVVQDSVLTLDSIKDYCLNQCYDYDEVKAIYNMLLELYFTNNDPQWVEAKKAIQKRMQDLKKGILKVEVGDGGEFNLEKKVEYEVKNVEAGGTGVNINKGTSK